MANKKISELAEDGTLADGSLLEVASLSGGSFTSKKTLLSTLSTYVMGKLRAAGHSYVIAKSGVAVSTTGQTTEVMLASVVIPAGAIGPNGQVEVIPLWSGTSSANTKTFRVKLGGALLYGINPTTLSGVQAYIRTANRGSVSSQVTMLAAASFGQFSPANIVTTAVNTGAATTLEITAQLAVGTETATLESYLVRITPGS